MPRPKKPSPIKDIFLAGKMQGYAFQLNVDTLQQYIDSNPSDFSYKGELQATINYAKAIQKGIHNANIPVG